MPTGGGAALLAASGLSKAFHGVPAVDGVDLTLDAGECVGVIGPNGAGKSTLLGLIGGGQAPDAGTLCLNGADVTGMPLHRRVAAGIAQAAQIPQTFGRLSVRDNLRLPAGFGARLQGAAAEAWVAEVLELCGLADRADAPAGTLGLLGRKRLELAKAVAAQPRVLLLDEVAAGLTEPEIEAIMELVRSLRAGRAILWVEHIPFALRGVCARLVVMDKGAKTLDGPFETVWADPSLQEIYMGVPEAEGPSTH